MLVCGNLETMCKSEVDMDFCRHGLGSADKTLGMVEGEPRKPWAWLSRVFGDP